MTKKGSIIYKIITLLTLILPSSIYLIVFASIKKQVEPDIYLDTVYTGYSYPYEFNGNIVYFNTFNTIDGANVINNANYQAEGYLAYQYRIELGHNQVIDINGAKYVYRSANNSIVEFDTSLLVDEINTQNNVKISISVVLSLVAIAIAGIVIAGKMKVLKNHPRIATALSLIIGTGVLLLINWISGSFLNVFIVITASWLVYCIEYSIAHRGITAKQDLVEALKGVLK